MKMTTLVMGLALALGLTACNKKASEPAPAPKAAEPATLAPPPKTEPAKPAPKAMTGADLVDQYKKCGDMLNAGKYDDFKTACVADSYVGHMGAMDMKVDQLVPMFQSMKTAMPDEHFEPQLILANGHTIYAIALMTGTQDGTMKMPGMADLPATHKKTGSLFFHKLAFDDTGKTTEEWSFEDGGTFAAQLGIAPKGTPPHREAMTKGWDGAPITAVAADDAKEKANVDLMTKMNAAFDDHKAADMEAMVTDDFVESDQTDAKDHVGKKELDAGVKQFVGMFPDAKLDATVTGAGDYVVSIGTFTGTTAKDKKKVTVPYAEIGLVKDGKLAKLWRFFDSMEFAKQMK